MKKNYWVAGALLILTLLMLTGCMSKEEKARAEANEKTAKTLVNDYLKEIYGSGKVTVAESLQEKTDSDSPVPNFSRYASDYVRTWVKADKSEFSVLVNVETGECYEERQYDAIRMELGERVVQALGADTPYSIELFYYPAYLEDELPTSKMTGFAPHDIQSLDDLIASGNYKAYVVLNYVNHPADIESLNGEALIKALIKALDGLETTVAVLNYRNSERYVANVFEDRTFSKESFGDAFAYYRLSDVWMLEDGEVDSVHYESQTVHGIEFAWNTALVKPSFTEVESASEITTEYYSGATFTSTDPISVEIACEGIPYMDKVYDAETDDMVDKEAYSIRIYCFFDTEKYREQMVIQEYTPSDFSYDIWTLDWKSSDYVYRWISGFEESLIVTMGYYERESK